MGKRIEVRVEPRGYEIEFAALGCVPSPLRYGRRSKSPTRCFLLAEGEGERSVERDLIGGLLQRYLQRGANIPPTPKVEDLALRKSGVIALCEKSEGEEEKYNVLEEGRPDLRRIGKRLVQENCADIPRLEKSLRNGEEQLFDSPLEEKFLTEWAPEMLQEKAAYLFPQYYMRNLTGEVSDERRVDFLYYDGTDRNAIVIELDGNEHSAGREVDQEREMALRAKGVRTIRVPNFEANEGRGPQLEEVLRAIRSANEDAEEIPGDGADEWMKAVLCCDEGLSIQYALTRMFQRGKIGGAKMVVEVGGCTEIEVIEAAAREWVGLNRAFMHIHGIGEDNGVPEEIEVREIGGYKTEEREGTVRVMFEAIPAWWHSIPDGKPDVIIRPAESLVEPAVEIRFPKEEETERTKTKGRDTEEQKAGLKTLLRDAFRKRNFREAQEEAILRCVAGKDTVVLLPTGAGKSLIYQMVSLVKPGPTLVVAPLVALIEDQIEGLKEIGIDRVEGITGAQGRETKQEALERLRDGATLILIVAPERLLMPEFRQAIGVLHQGEGVGLVVIDEGHCVSEWGHDFRPAYLQAGKALREILGQPTLLALTGTASRAVYRDMMAHLEIDRNDPDAAIRPRTHDRPEIKMELRYCTKSGEASIAREAALRNLPQTFGTQGSRFWRARGKETCCGIVFMPTVGGRENNIDKGVELVRRAGASSIVAYAGSGRHAQNRRESAQKYKRNEAVAMVATGAYGMGIDKPNVRWVMHPHLAMSLEGYYQQIGRAGRDKQAAQAIAVMYEEDPERTDSVLDPEKGWEEAKEVYSRKSWWEDDVGTALFFHFSAFKGKDQEKISLRKTIEKLKLGEGPGERLLAFGRTNDNRSRTKDEGKERERDLGRLSRLGIVIDYEVDYGAKRFKVVIGRWTTMDLGTKLKEYVSRFDRARAVGVEADLNKRFREVGEEVEAQSQAAAEVLVDYLYSSVERARRRAIQETVLMARTCRNDKQIRQRMLDYLSEGKGAEAIEELPDAEQIEWDRLRRLFDDVETEGKAEAGRLRGMFVRALESNPEHPALLLGRTIAEAICDDGKFEVVEQGARAAIRALPKYVANSEPDIELKRIEGLIRLVGERTGGGIVRAVQWMFWQPLAERSTLEQAFAAKVRKWGAGKYEEDSAKLFHVRDAVHKLGEITTTWASSVDRLESKPKSA